MGLVFGGGDEVSSQKRWCHVMHELFAGSGTDVLDVKAYLKDFEVRFWRVGPEGFWKLERQQWFREPGTESWEAFVAGEWGESLRLIEAQRRHYGKYLEKIAAAGFGIHRVRVVELPVVPYVQWELHLLQLKAECGEDTRVVMAGAVAGLERLGVLPEVVVLGDEVMYEVLYDDNGELTGARRVVEPQVVAAGLAAVQRLHASGERLGEFFAREVAGLAAPAGE